ncbi:MAG: MGMT family protein [Chlorobiaceae bacterium]
MAMKQECDFFLRVCELVSRVPPGRVTTYGDVAEQLGLRSSARMVGWALSAADTALVPAHRVVNRFGALTGRGHFLGADTMRSMLEAEGVSFREDGTVELTRHRHPFSPSERS